MTRGTLTGTGWVDWPRVLDLLGEDECLWIDLARGPHLGPAPATLPVGATHLWGWRRDRWTRVRIDGQRALASVLSAGREPGGEPLEYRVTDGEPWGDDVRAAEWHARLWLLVTEGVAPITFAEVRA
jgi:hypothetical protein